MSTVSGEVEFSVPNAGRPCKTWYTVRGDLTKSRPLVALHGGPGSSHEYLDSLLALESSFGTAVILYDQIGSGRSTHLREKAGDTTFWTVNLFLRELDNLLVHLGISGDYDLFGSSWGGMLAAEHAICQPPGLKHLILASAPASMALFVEGANRLRLGLDQTTQDTLNKHEKEGTTDSKEYEEAVDVFYRRHLCTLETWPESVQVSMKTMSEDMTVYLTMNGPSEFYVTGSLKSWSAVDRAENIIVPTLLTNGRYDEVQDIAVDPFFRKIRQVKWVTFEKSAHMSHQEEPARYNEVVHQFLAA